LEVLAQIITSSAWAQSADPLRRSSGAHPDFIEGMNGEMSKMTH
jgi:hypothetical protein